MSIPCFIPSKDRAGQCDLLLNSLEKNAPGLFEPWVLYIGSNNEFKKGYELLEDKWRGKGYHWFIPEIDSEKQFYYWLDLQQNVYNNEAIIGLFSDDCIFYRPDDIGEVRIRTMFDTYGKDKVFSFTYRLGTNITVKDYVLNEQNKYKPEVFDVWGKIYGWNYTNIPFWQMHGFTVGFDGYIYRAKDLLELSERKSFGRICFWEKMICEQFQQKGSSKHFMASPKHSSVFVQQINVSHEFPHRSNHTFNMSCEAINQMWLDGYEISLENMDFSGVNCCHGEYPITFRKR